MYSFPFPYCTTGIEHNINLVSCQCEPLVVTMVRARLWPAAPQRPQIAFTFDLLDWAEALLLECQVALKDLCKALYFKCPHLIVKVPLVGNCSLSCRCTVMVISFVAVHLLICENVHPDCCKCISYTNLFFLEKGYLPFYYQCL